MLQEREIRVRPESSHFDLKSCSALQKGSTRGSGSRGKASFRVVVLPNLDVPEAGPVLVGIFAIQTFLFGIGSHDDGTATRKNAKNKVINVRDSDSDFPYMEGIMIE